MIKEERLQFKVDKYETKLTIAKFRLNDFGVHCKG